jgi:hypothetical protein
METEVCPGLLICTVSVVLYWSVLVVDAFLLLFSFGFLFLSFKDETGWRVTRVIKLLLPLIPLTRIVNLLLVGKYYFVYEGAYSPQQTFLEIFSSGFGGYLFISIYTLLIVFWVLLYSMAHSKSERIIPVMLRLTVILNAIIFTIWFLLLFLMFFLSSLTTTLHKIELIYAATLNALCCFGFVIAGGRLHYQLRAQSVVSTSSLKIARKVGFLTILCGIVFIIRSVILFMDLIAYNSIIFTLVSTAIFLTFCEAFPTAIVLIIISFEGDISVPISPQINGENMAHIALYEITTSGEMTRDLLRTK